MRNRSETAPADAKIPGRAEALRVWARVAALSFGGPAGQIAVMQRILVDEKRWISQQRFLHALNFCMFLPGPEAQQLATYIGWLMHRWRGALLAGGLFVLPGFISILALSLLYVVFGDSTLVEGIFFGIKPAVLAIVVSALLRIGRSALRHRPLQGVAAAAFAAIFAFGIPFPLIIAGAALAGILVERSRPGLLSAAAPAADAGDPFLLDDEAHAPAPPRAGRALATAGLWLLLWWVPVLLLIPVVGSDHTLIREAIFFSKVAVVTFGGAYAVLAYVAQQAVELFGWLQPGEMLDGLGMAETTPGPLIQVVQFVGFMGAWRAPGTLSPLAAAIAGACITTWVTFVPCFLWILTGAPWMEAVRGKRSLNAALAAITAAVAGVILNLSLWFAFHTLFTTTTMVSGYGMTLELPVVASLDPQAALIALLAFILVFGLRRGIIPTIGVCAACGVALRYLI